VSDSEQNKNPKPDKNQVEVQQRLKVQEQTLPTPEQKNGQHASVGQQVINQGRIEKQVVVDKANNVIIHTGKTDSRKGEISKRDLKEIDEWFKALKKLLSEKQITNEMFDKVVEYVIGYLLPSARFFVEDLKRNLANYPDWRKRLYLDKKEDDLKEVCMSVHQVLAAIRLKCDVVRVELGIRFLFVPPGKVKTKDGQNIVNYTHFYLAETPINEAQWRGVMEGSVEDEPNNVLAKVNLSIDGDYSVNDFIESANNNKQLSSNIQFAIPSSNQWLFAVTAAGINDYPEETLDKKPKLKTGLPSAFGLYDLCGVVWQFCQHDTGYELRGGNCNKTSFASQLSGLSCNNTAQRSKQYGFRPVLVISDKVDF